MSETSPNTLRQTIGTAVPAFELPVITGGKRSLDSFLDGRRGAVVVFWSSVCSHCARYDAILSSFEERHPEVALVAVASREQENPESLRKAARDRVLRFPILHDGDRVVAQRFEVAQTPRVFLIDDGRRLLYRGAIDNFKYPEDPDYEPYLEPAIEAFLAGLPIARAETASFGCPVSSVFYKLPNPLGSS